MLHKKIYQIKNGRALCVVIIGESNSGGNGSLNYVTTLEKSDNNRIMHLNNDTLKLEVLVEAGTRANAQLGHCPRVSWANGFYHGWELEVGNWARYGKLDGFDIYTIKGSQGGSLVANWLDEKEYNGGTCQVWALTTFKERIAALKTQMTRNKPVQYVILSSLGVNDANLGTDSYVYKEKYTEVIEAVRATIDVQSIPVYSTLFNLPDISGLDEYNDRQLEMESADPNFHTIDMTGQPFNIGDNNHWNSEGVLFFANEALTRYKDNYI